MEMDFNLLDGKKFHSPDNRDARSLSGPGGLAHDLIWQFSEFEDFLDQENNAGRIHYLYACSVFAGADQMPDAERREFAQTVMYGRRHEVLSKLARQNYPRNALKLLYKLQSKKPLGVREYYLLLNASQDRIAAKALRHAPKIFFSAFFFWHSLPLEFKSARLLSLVLANPESVGDLDNLIKQLLPAPSDEVLLRVGQSLASSTSIGQLKSLCHKWRNRFTEMDQFPTPPFIETDTLFPIVNGRELRLEGQSMKLSHLREMSGYVLQGNRYYYRSEEGERATLLLARDDNSDWSFVEAYRQGGGPLSIQMERSIAEIVNNQLTATR